MAAGTKVNLWKAVKIAKNLNCDRIPSNLASGGVPVAAGQAAESFGTYLSDKIKANVDQFDVDKARINPNGVYNRNCKLKCKVETS